MINDLLLIGYSWCVFFLFHLITFPFLASRLKRYLPDAGWGVSRSLGWLAVSLPVWYLGHFGFPINSKIGVWTVTLLLISLSTLYIYHHQKELIKTLGQIKPFIILLEVLFLFGLFFLSFVRSFNPDINGLEKFMDAGLIISYQKSPTLPMQDMWLAGYTFNYYTFGHFMGSIATFLLGVSAFESYNILLGYLMGLTMMLSASLVMNMLIAHHNPKRKVFAVLLSGAVAANLVAFAGNTQTIWYFLTKKTFVGYWYPDATRFIERTIHEFPSYSFIVSDLHAHVWNLTNVLTLLPFIFIWVLSLTSTPKSKEYQITLPFVTLSAGLGLIMGVLTMTSTWDALVFTLFFCLTSIILLFKNFHLFFKIGISGAIILGCMILSSSPWWINFESISEGVALTTEKSPIWQLFALWIGHAGIGLLTLVTIFFISLQKHKKEKSQNYVMIIGMVLTGLTLLILPEFFYMKDIYLTQPRANTMFKLTYQGFVFLSLTMAWFFGYLLISRKIQKFVQFTLYMIVGVIIMLLSIYPYFGYRDYYNLRLTNNCPDKFFPCIRVSGTYKGLDGLSSWLQSSEPGDYEAILWLNKTVQARPHILEAVGDSYTTYARISTFTGLPTVLGWRVHQWLWRGSYDLPGQRSAEVEQMYTAPLTESSQALLNKYRVEYIIIGEKEKEAYPSLQLNQLKSLGRVIFDESKTTIIQRDL